MKRFVVLAAITVIASLVIFASGSAIYLSSEGDTNGTGSPRPPQTAVVHSFNQNSLIS